MMLTCLSLLQKRIETRIKTNIKRRNIKPSNHRFEDQEILVHFHRSHHQWPKLPTLNNQSLDPSKRTRHPRIHTRLRIRKLIRWLTSGLPIENLICKPWCYYTGRWQSPKSNGTTQDPPSHKWGIKLYIIAFSLSPLSHCRGGSNVGCHAVEGSQHAFPWSRLVGTASPAVPLSIQIALLLLFTSKLWLTVNFFSLALHKFWRWAQYCALRYCTTHYPLEFEIARCA